MDVGQVILRRPTRMLPSTVGQTCINLNTKVRRSNYYPSD